MQDEHEEQQPRVPLEILTLVAHLLEVVGVGDVLLVEVVERVVDDADGDQVEGGDVHDHLEEGLGVGGDLEVQ